MTAVELMNKPYCKATHRSWQLLVTEAQLETLNALLPVGISIMGVQLADGRLVVCSDLLTDPENYGEAFSLLSTLETVMDPVFASNKES